MGTAGVEFRKASGGDRRRRAVRAWLFVALSAFAVPACQHYDADDSPERAQARHGRVVPVTVPALALSLPA